MRKKNLTPFRFAAVTTSRTPPRPEASIVVRGRFTLAPGTLAPHPEQGRLSAELFDEDDAERVGGATKPDDLAHFKLCGEVVLTGRAFAPGGKPVGESVFRLAVKTKTQKPLVTIDRRVFGKRVWTERLIGKPHTDPIPFTSMKIGWTESFGGEGFEANPVGLGIGTHELPNVEWAETISSRSDRPKPACPGPISPHWRARSSKLGKDYGKDWKKERAPYVSADFDWTYFQSAPVEQRIEGYFKGDETLEVVNLHRSNASFEASLPGLRTRVFLRDLSARFREVPMVLDTLHVDSEGAFVDLSWRGVDAVGEHDLSDLAFALVVTEPLSEPPRPLSDYEARMGAFVDDPLGLREAVPTALRPTLERAEALAAQQKEGARADGEQPDPLGAELERAFSALEPGEAATLRATIDKLREGAARLHDEAVRKSREAGKEPPPPLDETIAKAARRAAGPSPVDFDPQGRPCISLAPTLEAQRAVLDGVRAQTGLPPEARAKIDEIEQKLDDPRLTDLDPSLAGRPPLVEPGPGQDLRRRDLRGRDLSKADLSGADLSGALLSDANLTEANLSGAIFEHALLAGARLERANLSKAKLDGGLFLDAKLTGARLVEATLTQAVLARAVLDGAALDGARGMLVVLSKASLRGVSARGLDLLQSTLGEADLEGADLTGASLVRCLLRGAKARSVVLDGAKLGHVSFDAADLTLASLRGATGPFACFMRALLDRVDLRHAVLPSAVFDEARGVDARFDAANLPESRFYRSKLERASFRGANLFRADLGLAFLPKTSFEGASLFDAKLVRTSGEGCDFSNADLRRSTLEGA